MRDLVIETATEALSLALFENGALIGHSHELLGRGHAEQTVPRIAALPDGGRADRLFVDTGPGSFTGLRVGLAAAKALSFAWNVPLMGYSALALIAHMARAQSAIQSPSQSLDSLFVANTGGHGELFWQRFRGAQLEPMGPMCSTPIAQLAAETDDPLIFGTGAAALIAARGHGEARTMHPDAQAFGLLTAAHIVTSTQLVYGRQADAKPQPTGSAA